MATGTKTAFLRAAVPLLLLMLGVTLVVSCAACSSGVGEDTADAPLALPDSQGYDAQTYGDLDALDPRRQTVTFWHRYTGAHEELLLDMVDQFNRTNDRSITVFAESHGSCTSLNQRILSGLAAGQMPDLATACQDQVAGFAARNALVALDPYIDSPRWGYPVEELGDFFPLALAADYLPQRNTHYGWASHKSTAVMVTNQEWLAELGYESPPTTWDEFAEMACAAAGQPFSGMKGEGAVLGYEYPISSRHFTVWVSSRDGSMLTSDGSAYAFNGPAGLDSVVYVGELVNGGCAGPTPLRDGSQTSFGAGRVLFAISAVDRLPSYEQAVEQGAGFQWSVEPPPHGADRERPRMTAHGSSRVIFRSTPEKQLAAWLFIKWMSEPERQVRWAGHTGYFPTRRSAAELLAQQYAERPTYARALGFLSLNYALEPPVAGYDVCRVAIEEMLTAATTLDNPQQLLDIAVAKCNDSLRTSTAQP